MSSRPRSIVFAHFGSWLGSGLNLVMLDYGHFLLVSLLNILLSALSLGILSGPLSVGQATVVIMKFRGKPISAGDVFRGFNKFPSAFALWMIGVGVVLLPLLPMGGIALVAVLRESYWILLALIPLGLVEIALCLLLRVLWDMAYFFVADRDAGPIAAIRGAAGLFRQSPLGVFLYILVASLIGGAGAMLGGAFGVIFTFPFTPACVFSLYQGMAGVVSDPQ